MRTACAKGHQVDLELFVRSVCGWACGSKPPEQSVRGCSQRGHVCGLQGTHGGVFFLALCLLVLSEAAHLSAIVVWHQTSCDDLILAGYGTEVFVS